MKRVLKLQLIKVYISAGVTFFFLYIINYASKQNFIYSYGKALQVGRIGRNRILFDIFCSYKTITAHALQNWGFTRFQRRLLINVPFPCSSITERQRKLKTNSK